MTTQQQARRLCGRRVDGAGAIPMFGWRLTAQATRGNPQNAKRVVDISRVIHLAGVGRRRHGGCGDIVTPPFASRDCRGGIGGGQACDLRKPTASTAEAEAMSPPPRTVGIIDHELRFHPRRLHLRQLIKDGYLGGC